MLTALTAIAIVVGVAGTLLPFIPGIGLVWAAIVVYVFVDGFGAVDWLLLGVVSLIGSLGIYYGVRIPQKTASVSGLGWKGQAFAAVLAVVGFFVIPVIGAPIGFVAGVYGSMFVKDRSNAWTATKATLRSLVVASGIQLAAASLMGFVWLAYVVVAWVVD